MFLQVSNKNWTIILRWKIGFTIHILVLVVGYSDQEMEWFSSNRW